MIVKNMEISYTFYMQIMFKRIHGKQRFSARKEVFEQLRVRASYERKLNLNLITKFAEIGKIARDEYLTRQQIGLSQASVANKINEVLEPHYRSVIEEFGLRILRYRKQDSQFETIIREYYAVHGALAVTNISNTTIRRLQQILLAKEAEALGVAAIAQEIFDSMRGSYSRYRSSVIARTETHNAASFANHEIAKSLNLPDLQKQWVSVSDDRTRSNHAAMNGVRVPYDEDFDVPTDFGTVRMSRPSDPRGGAANVINCRCVLLYITPEDEVEDT